MTLQPSTYQQSIYDWVRTGSGSAVVIAVAGSGKTSTLVEVCKQLPPHQSVRLFAFNKPIAETLKARVPYRHVQISTYHSAGYQAILRELRVKVDTDRSKMRDLARELLSETDRRAYGEELGKLIGLAKGIGLGVLRKDLPAAWEELIDAHDLDFDWLLPPDTRTDTQFETAVQEEKARVIALAGELLSASNRAAQEPFAWRIDFDDQLYLPLRWDLQLPQYDWVLVDEAQDTNAIQREWIRRSLKPGGRLLVVGDPRQAIYGWRGASHDAVELIQREFAATTLPLSVCYRCATTIVTRAQTIVPQIEPAPGAVEGMVIEEAPRADLFTLPLDAAILCRNNAPLVKQAYELIARGIPCRVLGRDIGEGLKRLIYKLRAESVDALETRLGEYQAREVKRYRKLRQEGKAQGVMDRVTCIQTIVESLDQGERTVEGVVEAIEELFGDAQKDRLTLSTIHKAKGQEWGTVAMIAHYLLPSKWATKEWELRQEENLRYVAYTRARETLLIIDDMPAWMRKKREQEEERDETVENEIGVTEHRWDRR